MEEVGVAEARNALAMFPLAFTLPESRSPKIDCVTSKSPPVSIMLSNTCSAAAASAGGSGVPESLSSDQSPASDMILLDYNANH
jgi:hypothetical protein